jgi:L-aspartate oxidase
MNPADVTGQPVIIGAGIAGLAAALFLAPLPVVVINKGKFATGATNWAQGGIAAAIGADDAPAFHAADTIAVGGGLVDPAIAALVANAAPGAIETLRQWGVAFDSGTPGLEAGHSHPRIVHAGGDATGHEIIMALTERARQTASITLLEDVKATSLLVDDGAITGVAIAARSGESSVIATGTVILATGGIGQLYLHTTNPPGAGGSGLLLAARAGAVLKDMEFVQFHPTAMDIGKDPMPLATEALRGQGARLITETGDFIMAGAAKGDLSPRDVVARTIWRSWQAGHQTFLDCRPVADFATRFPTVAATCASVGIDATATPIPIRPAAHYHMGGVEVDAAGRTSIAGLWACGEVACTGLNGANRLASNSLLEGIVFARQIADDIVGLPPSVPSRPSGLKIEPPHVADRSYREVLDRYAGVIRDGAGLETATQFLAKGFAAKLGPAALAFMIALCALNRRESRGAHFREDFPKTDLEAKHSYITMASANKHAEEILG